MDSVDPRPPLWTSRSRSLVPRRDRIFARLLEEALDGAVPVYFAIIPRAHVRPFDDTCDVAGHPTGAAAIREVISDLRASKLHYAWVYPQNGAYVLSDDYIIWAAAEQTLADYLPCWVLGFPSVSGASEICGPLEVSVVRLLREPA